MKAKIFTRVMAFAASFLASGVLSYLMALKYFFPPEPLVRQEAMWLMARGHGSDVEKLQTAIEGVRNEHHAFARYERAAIMAQIEVIKDGNLSDAVAREFCETLKWQRCEKDELLSALEVLFGKER